jgi:hypothetical protein
LGNQDQETTGNNLFHVLHYYMFPQFPNARTNASCNEPGCPGNLFGVPGPAIIQNPVLMEQELFYQYQLTFDYWHTMLLQNKRYQLFLL